MDFKVRCVNDSGSSNTVGKIYEIKNGVMTFDNGRTTLDCSYPLFKNVGQINQSLMSQFELVEDKQMTKDDLKVGYVVQQRQGYLKMIMETAEGIIVVNGSEYGNLDSYKNDLTNNISSNLDIVRVYGFTSGYPTDSVRIATIHRKLLWERKEEPIEITMQEIADWKGKPVSEIKIKE